MSFDEKYDEMLHDEFSARGKHQAKAATEPEPTESASRGRHAAAEEPGAEAAERPRGFQRYRTAGLVGAGGLACAAAGAFLGGLGGYFTISPAAAHPVAAPTITQDLPLAQAVSHGSHSSSGAKGTSAVMAASFSKGAGSLTQGIAPFATLTSLPLSNLPVGSLPGLGGTGGNGTGGGGNGTVGPVTGPPATTGGTTSNPVLSAVAPVLNIVTGALGSTGNPVPSLPLPAPTGTTVPSVTPPSTPSSGSTTVNVPVPVPVPVPLSPPPVTVGGLSVGVSSSGSTSGLTLNLP